MAQSSIRAERIGERKRQRESGKCHDLPNETADHRGWYRKLAAATIVPIGLAAGLLVAVSGPVKGQAIPGEPIPIQGTSHIAIGASHAPYHSNPPTSGPHYSRPANWGVYRREGSDEQFVHNLEHGGIWISYKGVDKETVSRLEKIAGLNPGSVIVSPRSRNDAPIAIASWGRLLKLEDFDERQIKLFIKININRSPEKLAR